MLALCGLSALGALTLPPLLGIGDDDGIETIRSDDEVRRTRVEGDLTMTLIGPERIAVDREASFTAEVTGAQSVRWLGPDGSVADGDDPLVVRAARPGDGSVTLLATSLQTGEAITIEAPFEVVEP